MIISAITYQLITSFFDRMGSLLNKKVKAVEKEIEAARKTKA